jgi:outer membrane protein assembly factor BamB
VAGDLVYSMSGLGRLACFDAKNGAEKWAVDMVKNLGGWLNEFGYSESVVVDDKKVYCFPGGKETNLAALDKLTGKTIWTSKAMGDTTSFCSAILINLPSKKILATFGRHQFFTVDCNDGKLLGSFPLDGFKYDGDHCNSPIYADGFIYLIVEDEDGKGTIKLKINSDGKVAGEVWSNKKVANGFGGFVKVGDRLFTTIKGN